MAKPIYKPLGVKFVQIVIGQWTGGRSDSYGTPLTNFSTLALGDDGKVYRYMTGLEGWVLYNHELVEK